MSWGGHFELSVPNILTSPYAGGRQAPLCRGPSKYWGLNLKSHIIVLSPR